MLTNFILTYRKATRALLVAISLLALWIATFAIIFWIPGVLDAIRTTIETVPEIFWFGSVLPGSILSVYFSIRGAHYLWVWSETIYEDLEE